MNETVNDFMVEQNRVEVSLEVSCDRSVVFALMADLPLLGQIHPYVKKIEYMTEETTGVNTISRWVVQKPGHPEITFEERITKWIMDEVIGFETISGIHMTGEILVNSTPTGTLVTLWETIHDGPPPDLTKKRASMMNQLLEMKQYLNDNRCKL